MKQVWQKIHHRGIDCLVPVDLASMFLTIKKDI